MSGHLVVVSLLLDSLLVQLFSEFEAKGHAAPSFVTLFGMADANE